MPVQLSLNLDGTTDEGLIQLSNNSAAAVTAHPDVFNAPKPPAAELAALTTAFQQSITNQVNTQAAATEATRLKAVARFLLEAALRTRGGYVVELGATVPSAPGLSNLPLRPTPAPVGLVAAPLGLVASLGDLDHTMNLVWDKVRRARCYAIQFCADPMSDAYWQHAGVSTKASYTVTGLTAGVKYWFRVAAVGAAGQGGWSDVTCKMAV